MVKLTAASFFAGGGGSSTGLEQAGFDVRVANEFLEPQRRIYAANHPGTIILPDDIRTLTAERVLEAGGWKVGEVDLVDGSPPCNDFSMSNVHREDFWGTSHDYLKNKKQRVDDLFMVWLRLVEGLQPRVVVGENVAGILKGKAKGYLEEVFRELRRMGYRVKAKLMNALYYGVPQRRERVIIIAYRGDLDLEPEFPVHVKGKPAILRDALAGIDDPGEFRVAKKGTRTLALWQQCPPGQTFAVVPEAKEKWFTWYRLSWDRPVPTIMSQRSLLYMPDEPRTLGLNEIKRLSGFPDDYELPTSFGDSWSTLGLSVPPPMMRAVGQKIARTLKKKVKKNSRKGGQKSRLEL